MNQIFAQSYPGDVNLQDVVKPSFTTIGSLTSVIVKNALTFAGLILLVLLIFGGFQFIVAAGSGDSKAMQKAQGALTSAFIGVLLVFGAYWIVQIISQITGIKLL